MTSQQCTGSKRDGTPCGQWAVPGSDPPRCPWHGGTRAGTGTRCSATTIEGPQCRGWAVPGTEPPLCNLHGGRPPGSAGPASPYPLKHGQYVGRRARTAAKKRAAAEGALPPGLEPETVARFCSLDGTSADLQKQNQRLSDYIDEHLESMPPEALARLLRIYDETNAALVALLRDQRGRRRRETESGLSDLVMETLILIEREGQ